MKTLFLIFSILLLSLSGCSSNNTTPENSNYEAKKQLAKNSNTSNVTNNVTNSSSNSSAPEELYRFATTIYTKTEERQNNVKICCNQLNGQIVSPNKTFSFCDALRTCKTRRRLPKG